MELRGSTMGDRPTGITVLALLSGLGCVLGVVLVLAALGGAASTTGGLLAVVGAVALVAVSGFEAYGLWTLRWWAWPLAVLSWIASGLGAVAQLGHGAFDTSLVVAPIAVVYLLMGETRAAFGPRIAAPSRRFRWATGALAAALCTALIGSAVAAGWSPTIPPDAGSTLVAHVEPVGPVATDPPAGEEAGTEITASACLDRIERPTGWLRLCWGVLRQPDADGAADYYRIRVTASFGAQPPDDDPTAGTGSGIRWLVAKVRLLVPVADGGLLEGWPSGDFEGECASVPVTGLLAGSPAESETVCGHTVGVTAIADRSHTVSWSCVGCVIADRAERAVAVDLDAAVAEGTRPAWDVFADFGD